MCRGTQKRSTKKYSAGRKTPRYSHNRATDYDLERYRLLGINVLRHTERVPKNVINRSKNPKVQSNPRNRLLFRRISSPGHKRVEAHRNSPQKRTHRVEKPPSTFKTELKTLICDKIFSWASTCRGTSK